MDHKLMLAINWYNFILILLIMRVYFKINNIFQKPAQVENGIESNEVEESRSELPAIDGAQENENLINSKSSITQSFANAPLLPAIPPPLPTSTVSDTTSWSVDGYIKNIPITLPPPPPTLPPPPPPLLPYPINGDKSSKSDDNFPRTVEGDQAFKVREKIKNFF